jgi:GT2 family glycosyltransferase
MDLSIIIVNWHSREYLKRCIASIRSHVRTMSYEIVVIDSGSFDGCDAMLREQYPEVRFIQSATNLGFARANNRAFDESVGDCLLFLNPDTELSGSAVEALYCSLQSLPDAGIVGGRLLNGDGTVQTSCIQSLPTLVNQMLNSEFLRTRWPRSSLWGMEALFAAGTVPRPVQAISGACLMVRRRIFEEVEKFSEEYFMYVEDIDLCYKVGKAGYTNYFVPDARVVHFGGSSSQQAVSAFAAVMIPEAIWRFLRKTRGSVYGSLYTLTMFASAVGRLAILALGSVRAPRSASRKASWCKWMAILRWSTGRDELATRYYTVEPSAYGSAKNSL